MPKDAQHYVKIHCDYLLANHLNSEIALEAPHTLGKLMEHLGEMPTGSGFFHDVLSGRVDRMRKLHPDFNFSVVLLSKLTNRQYWTVCAWELLINKRPEESEKVLRSGVDVARYLNRDYKSFNECRNRGIDRLNAELGVFVA